MAKPLEGIRVVDLTTFVAAPVCGRLLADLGARVIKVERPEGDGWRATGKGYHPVRFNDQENPIFDIYNSGKEHIALNLKTPEGMEVFHKLLESADVFITNTRPAALKRLGLDYESLKDKYPRLVYGIVLGYGENGPDKDRPAFDTSAFWARNGFLRDQNVEDENYQPVQPPFGMGDTITGYLLMGQICAALMGRQKTGKGDYVRSGLMHNGIFVTGSMQIMSQQPFGRHFPQDRPAWGFLSGSFRCSDNDWVFLSGYNDAQFPKVYAMLGISELEQDPRFCTPEEVRKPENKKVMYDIVRERFATQSADYWLEKAVEFDLPLTRMNHYEDVTKDPQAWANGYFEQVTFANGHVDVMPSSPIEMDSVGKLTTQTAPEIGAHTDAILQELGYDAQTIKNLHQTGAVK